SGVGKPSLINTIFNVDDVSVQHYAAGEATIDKEITSPQNPRFVLHDSQGYQPGDVKNFDMLKTFVSKRRNTVDKWDRIYVIWCLFQDRVHPSEIDRKFEELAREEVEKTCISPLQLKTRNRLVSHVPISSTSNYYDISLSLELAGSVALVFGMAQRVDSNLKICDSIIVGQKIYWSGLVTGAHFFGSRLEGCLAAIHDNIVKIWNIRGLEEVCIVDLFQVVSRSADFSYQVFAWPRIQSRDFQGRGGTER
ncbi:hypothetical protein JAAARDRAFT_710855, partial [Jaapia argillacea MUCL 33604]